MSWADQGILSDFHTHPHKNLYTYIQTHSQCDLDTPSVLDLAPEKNGEVTYVVTSALIFGGIGIQGCPAIEANYNGRSVTFKNLKAVLTN